jgi:hypothetical protein
VGAGSFSRTSSPAAGYRFRLCGDLAICTSRNQRRLSLGTTLVDLQSGPAQLESGALDGWQRGPIAGAHREEAAGEASAQPADLLQEIGGSRPPGTSGA